MMLQQLENEIVNPEPQAREVLLFMFKKVLKFPQQIKLFTQDYDRRGSPLQDNQVFQRLIFTQETVQFY